MKTNPIHTSDKTLPGSNAVEQNHEPHPHMHENTRDQEHEPYSHRHENTHALHVAHNQERPGRADFCNPEDQHNHHDQHNQHNHNDQHNHNANATNTT